MTSWTLEIAGRTVLRSPAGPPEVERALVVASERAPAEKGAGEGAPPQVVYCTTARLARERLAALGITPLALAQADFALRGLAHRFARGDAVRQMLLELGPEELFDGHVHHANDAGGYEGLVLDMRALAAALDVAHAGGTLQAFALASRLAAAPEDAEVRLVIGGANGESHAALDDVRVADAMQVVQALRNCSAEALEAAPRAASDLLELLLEKGVSRDRFSRIQQSLTVTPPPSAGPLSEPEAWAIELGLGTGELSSALERIESLEKSRGKRPVTIYLRSRAALLLGSEPPRSIAERVESLCATQAFPELSLLAAQAWLAAGEPDRAVPFARAVLLSTQSSRIAREMADHILSDSYGGGAHDPPSADAILTPLDLAWDDHVVRPSTKFAHGPNGAGKADANTRPSQRTAAAAATKERSSSRFALALPRRPSRLSVPRPASSLSPLAQRLSRPPPPPKVTLADLPSTAREPSGDMRSRRTRPWVSTPPVLTIQAETEPMVPVAKVITIEARLSQVPTPPPPLPDETLRMEASASVPDLVTQRQIETPPVRNSRAMPIAPASLVNRPSVHRPTASPAAGTRTTPSAPMHGASMPAFQSDPPPQPPFTELPRAPRLPRLTPAPPELAETLSLPPGLHGQIAPGEDDLPRTYLDARVMFTHMARRLGREYREKHGILLGTTMEGIEQMQAVLRDRFPDGLPREREDRLFVRRHGAFLSEILARTLEAEWVDIAPTEIGYWAMVIPPKTRVWPFGRVLRLLARGHRERDLVSYYLELKNRAFRDRP